LFALLDQSIEFLFGLVIELLEESLFVLFYLLFELIKEGDDLISLGEGRRLDVGLHQANDLEGGFDLLALILNSVDKG